MTKRSMTVINTSDESSYSSMKRGRRLSAFGEKLNVRRQSFRVKRQSNNSASSMIETKSQATERISKCQYDSSQNEVTIFPPRSALSRQVGNYTNPQMANDRNFNFSSQRTASKRQAIQRAVLFTIHVTVIMLPLSILSLLCAQDGGFSAKESALQTLRAVSSIFYVISPILYVFRNKGIKKHIAINPGQP